MKTTTTFGFVALFATAVAGAAGAQNGAGTQGSAATAAAKSSDSSTSATTAAAAPKKVSLYRPQEISNLRPGDQRGVNVFETPKADTVPFTGFALSFGG